MPLCIDASVAVKWFCPEEGKDEALVLLRRYEDGERLVEPDSFFIEVVSGLVHHMRKGNITADEMDEAVQCLAEFDIDAVSARDVMASAGGHALDLSLTAWDAVYLAVAEAEVAEFWTADGDFKNAAQALPLDINFLMSP